MESANEMIEAAMALTMCGIVIANSLITFLTWLLLVRCASALDRALTQPLIRS